jgi:O-antigen ligase
MTAAILTPEKASSTARVRTTHSENSQQPSRLEKAYFIVALLILSGAVMPLLRQSNPSALTIELTDPIQQYVYGLVYLVGFGLYLRKGRSTNAGGLDPWLLCLLFLTFVSVAWSSASSVTIRSSVALLATTAFGVVLARRFRARDILELVAFTLVLATLLSLLFAVAIPKYGIAQGIDHGVRGVYLQKNILARVMALASFVFFLLSRRERKRWFWRVMLLLSVGMLVASNSTTGLLVTAALFVITPLLSLLRRNDYLIVTAIIAAVLLAAAAGMWFLGNEASFLGVLGKDTTLTGRTELWQSVGHMIRMRLLTGYGFNGFWLGWDGPSAAVWARNIWEPVQSQNGFLDLALDLGIIGLALFAGSFLGAVRRAVGWGRRVSSESALFALGFLVFLFLYNITESTLLKQNSFFWVMYVFTATSTLSSGALRRVGSRST